ncbi:hypothetical protein [Paraburkholderia bannensis]|uniref:hypothetical protein n=1 Tax=Paraburkholderia bannensis TaxID=765414 RepID=UPI0004865820|nr:hypothetical protein [Paraburkholderia bannensis]
MSEQKTLYVEKSGKIAADIKALVRELHRQIVAQSHPFTTEFRLVITHEGADVSYVTKGPDFLAAHDETAVNVRGERIDLMPGAQS